MAFFWASVLRCWSTVACCFRGSIVISTCPARTWSPDFTRMRVSVPSTCGWMVAERRDLTVATYSSVRGTGDKINGLEF